MPTSVSVALQSLNDTTFANHRFFLTLDPAFDIGGFSRFFLEGFINRVSLGINEHIGTAELAYDNRPFGSRIGSFVLPAALYIDNADNFIFRGFFVEEEGRLNSNQDDVAAICYDYKWFINKLSKIRGKIYTIDNNIYPQFIPGDASVFADESLYEKFRYIVPGLNKQGVDQTRSNRNSRGVASIDGTGYIGTEETIFNKNGTPDCSADNPYKNIAFLFDSDIAYLRGLGDHVGRRSSIKYFWNYASILRYICTNYITNVFNGSANTTKILINETSLATIMRYGEKYGMEVIIPHNFNITNKSPLEAIDMVVKHIPGSWYWRLLYFRNTVLIDIQNHSDPDFKMGAKYLFIGNGGKLNNKTNNNVNVTGINVKYSVKDSVSHAVAVGGPIDIETTVQYIPGWPQYIRPTTDFTATTIAQYGNDVDDGDVWDGVSSVPNGYYVSDFKGYNDYEKWYMNYNNDTKHPDASTQKLREMISSEDRARYGKIYRVYIFPENQSMITNFPDAYVSDMLDGYQKLLTFVDQMFYRYILRPRRIKGPLTKYRQIFQYAPFTNDYTFNNVKQTVKDKHHDDPPFVFLFDQYIASTIQAETAGANQTTINSLLRNKSFILPEEEKNHSYQFENGNKVIIFQEPQFCRYTVSGDKIEHEIPISPANFYQAVTRNVFATCRIECDVPLIKDKIDRKVAYSNARLVTQEINHDLTACIRVNAFFPNPSFFSGSDLSVTQGPNSNVGADNDIPQSTINDNGVSASFVGNKLVNWNVYEQGADAPPAVLILDDSYYLEQIIQYILDDKPLYEINASADLGRVDTSYHVGDRIDGVKGSELPDGSGGYYNMDCVITNLEYSALGIKDNSYTSKMTLKNTFPIVQYLLDKYKRGRIHGFRTSGR